MLSSTPAKPLSHQKRTPHSLYPIFTTSPVSTCLKKPLFNRKAPSNSNQSLETYSHCEDKENHKISSPLLQTEAVCLKQGAGNGSSEVKVQPRSPSPEPPAVTAPPSCEGETPSAGNSDEDDEDHTIFYTPELFEGEEDEGSLQAETRAELPLETAPSAESQDSLLEGLLGSERARGHASALDGQSAISDRKEGAELSQGQEGVIAGQKQSEEGQEVETQIRQADSKLNRLSRSRQTAPTATGNQQSGHEK